MKFAMCVKNIDVKLPTVPKFKLLGNSKFNHLTIILTIENMEFNGEIFKILIR